MSLLSRERLVISLAPDRMSALRLGGRRRGQVLDQHSSPLVQVSGGTPWTSGLEAIEILLDDPAWGGRDITLVLSSHYVRYVVLPKGKQLAAVEQTDLARLIFRNIFGDLARDWELRVSPGGQQPTVASGIPRGLLSELLAACEGRASLSSIQPGLMTVFNRVRSSIGQHSGTLALVEAGRITLASIDQGQWQSISSRAVDGSALPDLLAENQVLAGQETGGRLWLCDMTGKAQPPAAPWRLERLVNSTAGATGLAGWGVA